jgi:hypothetical protein
LYLSNGDTSLGREYIEVSCERATVSLRDFRQSSGLGRLSLRNSLLKLQSDMGHEGQLKHFLGRVAGNIDVSAEFSDIDSSRLTILLNDRLRAGTTGGNEADMILSLAGSDEIGGAL